VATSDILLNLLIIPVFPVDVISAIANPHLNDDPGTIIAFPDEILRHHGAMTGFFGENIRHHGDPE
jgi:hypothetical protein